MTESDGPTSVFLAMQIGGMSALGMDVREVLASLCRVLPRTVGAAGAVFVLVAVPDVDIVASDSRAGWLGELQQRSRAGPVYHALRSGKPMITPDLTRVGPPEVAAAAAETGLVHSVVVPLMAGDERLGGLQLLGDDDHPVGAGQVDAVGPLVEAVSARLSDVLAFKELAFAVAQARELDARAPSGPRATVDRRPSTARNEPDDEVTAVIAAVPPADPTGGAADAEGEVEDRPDECSAVVGWFSVVEPEPDHSGSASAPGR
jgi:GAF domain-containing protein